MQTIPHVDRDAVYDDSSLILCLGFSPAILARARRAGLLRYARQGRRTVYLGSWLLEWLEAVSQRKESGCDA